MLPTFAYEHKAFVGPFSRAFPKAKVGTGVLHVFQCYMMQCVCLYPIAIVGPFSRAFPKAKVPPASMLFAFQVLCDETWLTSTPSRQLPSDSPQPILPGLRQPVPVELPPEPPAPVLWHLPSRGTEQRQRELSLGRRN